MNAIGMLLVDRFPRPQYMGVGVLGCQSTLIIEAALVANFVPSDNQAALQAAVAMFFIYQVFYGAMLDGTQFSYLGEIFPTHLRAKGICLGVAMISLMNIIWLQSAPTAFENIGWKFYLALIIPGTIGGFIIFFLFPDTHDRPLEEIAEIFGDRDEVAIYQRDVIFDPTTHTVVEQDNRLSIDKAHTGQTEKVGDASTSD
jgi:MFS family permease